MIHKQRNQKLNLAHRIRLYPNNVQATHLVKTAGVARFAYNWGLARWNELYEAGEKRSWQKLNAELNAIKREQFPWMYEVTKWASQKALNDLGDAFNNFFRRMRNGDREKGHPKFKKKGHARDSFYVAGADLKFDRNKVRVPRLGWIRMAESIRFPGRVVGSRFTKRADKWFVSLQIEVADSWVYPHQCKNQVAVGIDLGVVRLAIPSKGEPTDAPRALRFYEKRLKRLQRQLARRQKGSNNREKTKLKIQKAHEKIANIRRDVTHKLTSQLVRDFRWIGIEDLNVKGMLSNRYLAKSVADAALGEVRRQLEYKAPLAGSTVVVADRFYPSSKRCHICGHVLKRLLLSKRQWCCPACSSEHDRDHNAAMNLEQLAAGYAVKACGEGSSGNTFVGVVKLPLMKQESSSCKLEIVTA